MNLAFPPPQRWQDFEELTVTVFRAVFDDPGAQGHGRQGQAQHGVDVFGRERGNGRVIGIQCKQKAQNPDEPAATLSADQVDHESKNARDFRPSLDYFIMATTGPRDAQLQQRIFCDNEVRDNTGSFPIGLWFWEDFVGFINRHKNVLDWYTAYAENTYGPELQDRQILNVVRTALSRAAFRTPLQYESSSELRQALLDSLRAIDTGLLLDRETRLPICSAPLGLSGLKVDKGGSGAKVVKAVHKARLLLDAAMKNGDIEPCGTCLLVRNPKIASDIDAQRRLAIKSFNALLTDRKLDPIDSPLLMDMHGTGHW